MNTMYRVKLCGLRSQFNDFYRDTFILLVLILLGYGLFLPEVTLIKHLCFAAGIGGIPSLLLGVPCKMQIRGEDDRRFIEKYLANHSHVKSDIGWIPKLPKYLYFKSQAVRIVDGVVFGPRMTISRLQKDLSANWIASQSM